MDKSGTDKIISVYWFVILFIVAGAIVYMAVLFYGQPYEVRKIEADIMINQIADCLSQGGYLNEEIIDDEGKLLLNENNFLEICHLNFNVEEESNFKEQEQYYVEVSFYDFNAYDSENFNQPDFKITKGNINLKDFCDRGDENCAERSFYVLDKNSKSYEIKILSVVKKTEKNVQ